MSLMLWIGANTSYSVDLSLPEVIRMDRAPLEYQYFQGKVPKDSDIHGFYNLKDKKIYIREEYPIDHPWAQGLLLHELLHYVQDMNREVFLCIAEMEKDVWPLQQKYLKEVHNYDWEYDALWYIVISTCQRD
tara:strand:+ start:319 stop:714 length:396 start_codon:yes stop_codon:yes gene_type:complete